MEFQTPDSIMHELLAIRLEASKGVEALFDAEKAFVAAELEYDRAYSLALLHNKGTVVDRQALATLESSAAREGRDLAKAVVSRVRTKLRVLSEQQMNIQTQARMVELMWKQAGVER